MTRRLPNLNQLRAFEAAARHLSFKAAARELFVTQAAISHQIKALEEYFGCKLFDRLGRDVKLTDAAGELSEQLTVNLDQIAEASHQLNSRILSGTIRVSVTPFYAHRLLVPYFAEFKALYPKLTVELDYSYELADFSQDNVDAALRHGPGGWSGLDNRLIHYDRVAPVASPLLLGDRAARMTASEVAGFPLAAVKEQIYHWKEWFEAAGLTVMPDLDCSEFQHRGHAIDFALAGNGVALADVPLIQHELESGSLVLLSRTKITLDRGIHLVQPKSQFMDRRISVFGDWLTERIKEYEDE